MKTKTLIIIGSILIFGIILVTDVSQSQLEWNKVIEEDRIKHDESTSLNCAEGYIVSEGKCIIDCGVN
ncbi:MAG: hypothetical protein J4F36_11770, partial [Nitrosopumilaceae archaeon]|nr:hypothetical protein [Nitrosopumilaceae archaeon]